jgi:hypothetical protein
MNERKIALTHSYIAPPKRKALLDTIEQLAKIISLVIVPLIVAYIGILAKGVVTDIKNRDLEEQYFALAWQILSTPPPPAPAIGPATPEIEEADQAMRHWAVKYLARPQQFLSHPPLLPGEARKALETGRYLVPPPIKSRAYHD